MTAHEASSSSSFKSKLWSYDVFLSFSGEDTRSGSHLYGALKDRGYYVFIGEDDLRRGEEIKENMFRAIEESRISIIVFSKMYADSSWCLDELVKIMECRDKLGRHVLPIFYHVDSSHVRKQDGDLAEAFQKYEKDIREEKDDKKREAKQERVKLWREALTEVANLSGYHLKFTHYRRESDLIREIVDNIIPKWLPSTNELNMAKHPAASEEWPFLFISLGLEIFSIAFDQASSPSKPQYALFGMLLAIVGVLICVLEFIYKGIKGRVELRRWGKLWWFYYPPPPCYKPLGTVVEIYGFVGGIAQCVASIIQYVYFSQHLDSPFKVSLLPAILVICVITSRLSKDRMWIRDEAGGGRYKITTSNLVD